MGMMADRLNSMVVRAASPDGRIEATVTHPDQVGLRFVDGAYQCYDERALEHQLARLATLAWVEQQRYYFAALSEATGELVRADEYEEDWGRKAFQQEQAELPCVGTSPGGWVRAEAQGLVRWRVTITDGALRRLTEEQFCQEAVGTVAAVLTDYYAKTVTLKDRYFDLRLPKGRAAEQTGRDRSGQER